MKERADHPLLSTLDDITTMPLEELIKTLQIINNDFSEKVFVSVKSGYSNSNLKIEIEK
jgi:hypothetical protein